MLAHSLSGAAIQLQGARMLAEREQAPPPCATRSTGPASWSGTASPNARQAVGALRGEELPGVAQLDALIERFRADMDVDVTFPIEGTARPLPAMPALRSTAALRRR